MESDGELRQQLAEAERAGAAPYVDYPPMPKWFPPAAGAWAALLVLALGAASDRPAVFVPVLLALFAVEGAFFAWYRRYNRTMPLLRGAPREMQGAFRRYAVGVVVVIVLGALACLIGGPMAGAAVAFLTVTIGLTLYERTYAAAAEATRRRLASSHE